MEGVRYYRLSDRTEVPLVPYLSEKLAERDDIRLYIGTDSQQHGRETWFASVIVLHYGNNGGHVVYSKKKVPRIRSREARLWQEVEESVALSNYLVAQGFDPPAEVHVDLNPDPKYGSNSLLRAALGYVEGSGYAGVAKHGSFAASHVADKLCK